MGLENRCSILLSYRPSDELLLYRVNCSLAGLIDADVPRDRTHIQQETPAADFAFQFMFAQSALHGHFAVGEDVARDRTGVEREALLAG